MDGRVALVTGASGGIGRAIARGLAAAGASVGLGYGSGADAAGALAEEIGGVAVGADLRDASAAEALVGAVERELGPVDVLVANAGLGRVQPYEEVTAADFDEMLAVNLRAPFLLAQRVLPGMRERGWGRVLFTSSVAAFTGGIVGPHYAASKAGLHGLTHHLAARVAADGVTVNALAPALITDTKMLPGEPEELKARIPVGRLGRPEEIADLALAVLRNGYVTNQVISADGGIHPR
jgi:3-oxoacyl-[acyl-carrier protein] reductase